MVFERRFVPLPRRNVPFEDLLSCVPCLKSRVVSIIYAP